MRVLGLTGGIASGKSTVAKILQQQGAILLDADQIARDLAKPASCWCEAVRQHFGDTYFGPDGQLHREKLGAYIFSHPDERIWLDQISHPLIRQEILRRLQGFSEECVVLDIPLLYEAGFEDLADVVWVVSVPEDVQLSRLMKRNALSLTEARKRIAAQMPLAEKCQRADVVIDNRGSLETTVRQVLAAWEKLSRIQQSGNMSTP